ncbi:MAG TPA: hypothetical protein DEV81_00990 [Cyanobacteria bacterium UBA11049]|nr:hypothetical protein [Cyanobacteria bacterium UBA11049]
MPRLNARKTNRGFSLIEILVIVVIIGILSAIAIPSFLATMDRTKLDLAVAQVRGALQEAQRQAIRHSEPCTVSLDITNRKVTATCQISGDRTLPDKVAVVTNISATPINSIQIVFGILGTAEFTVASSVTPPPVDSSGKMVFYMSSSSISEKKCIALSNTLGLSRIGNYSGSTTAPDITDSGICSAS